MRYEIRIFNPAGGVLDRLRNASSEVLDAAILAAETKPERVRVEYRRMDRRATQDTRATWVRI